jgi:hypothetical protein
MNPQPTSQADALLRAYVFPFGLKVISAAAIWIVLRHQPGHQ